MPFAPELSEDETGKPMDGDVSTTNTTIMMAFICMNFGGLL